MGTAERKERERLLRRESIINAAESVFFENGFEKTTMDDVATKAELSKGTLYLYFKSKGELHLEVVLRATRILNQRLAPVINSNRNGLEKLVATGKEFIAFSKELPEHILAITELQGLGAESLGKTRDELRYILYNETPVKYVLQFIEQAIGENLIRKDIPPLVIAHTLWLQFISVVKLSTSQRGLFEMIEFSAEQLYESHLELVLNGIKS